MHRVLLVACSTSQLKNEPAGSASGTTLAALPACDEAAVRAAVDQLGKEQFPDNASVAWSTLAVRAVAGITYAEVQPASDEVGYPKFIFAIVCKDGATTPKVQGTYAFDKGAYTLLFTADSSVPLAMTPPPLAAAVGGTGVAVLEVRAPAGAGGMLVARTGRLHLASRARTMRLPVGAATEPSSVAAFLRLDDGTETPIQVTRALSPTSPRRLELDVMSLTEGKMIAGVEITVGDARVRTNEHGKASVEGAWPAPVIVGASHPDFAPFRGLFDPTQRQSAATIVLAPVPKPVTVGAASRELQIGGHRIHIPRDAVGPGRALTLTLSIPSMSTLGDAGLGLPVLRVASSAVRLERPIVVELAPILPVARGVSISGMTDHLDAREHRATAVDSGARFRVELASLRDETLYLQGLGPAVPPSIAVPEAGSDPSDGPQPPPPSLPRERPTSVHCNAAAVRKQDQSLEDAGVTIESDRVIAVRAAQVVAVLHGPETGDIVLAHATGARPLLPRVYLDGSSVIEGGGQCHTGFKNARNTEVASTRMLRKVLDNFIRSHRQLPGPDPRLRSLRCAFPQAALGRLL